MMPQWSKGPQVVSTTLRRAVLVATIAIAVAIAIACADNDPATPAPARTSSVAEQQQEAPPQAQRPKPPQAQEQQQATVAQQDAQTTEYVADVSQDTGWPALPLTASDRAQFCADLARAVAWSQTRANLWNTGQTQDRIRDGLRDLGQSAQDASAASLEMSYQTTPPINALLLQLASVFNSIAEMNRAAAGAYDRTEKNDRGLASLVRRAWLAVADYCRS